MKNKKLLVNKKGQFTLIAAILVAIVLIAAVMATYASIQYNNQTDPQLQSAIDQTNIALDKILAFSIGYYGSVIKVTANEAEAQTLTGNYINSGLNAIQNLQSDLGISFTTKTKQIATNWFSNASYSAGNLTVTYSLSKLSISGLTYSASCQLKVNISQSVGNKACITVLKDDNEPVVNLGLTNFKFYNYTYSNSTWDDDVYPTGSLTSYANGTYLIDVPSGVDPDAYIVSVVDTRGISVSASTFSMYTSSVSWNSAYVKTDDYITVEFLQNGTMNMIGQHLVNQSTIMPVPPVAVKSIHVNMTFTNGTNQEVPFQIEDWASDYQVPLGLTNNGTVFGNRQMIVFLINRNVIKFTIWWDGHSNTNQTTKAYTNLYFKNDDTDSRLLRNSILTLYFGSPNLQVESRFGSTPYCTADFMWINGEDGTSTGLTFVIDHGIVRDIVRQEAEWGDGAGDTNDCPNLYANIVIKFSALTTYYTYDARLMFLDSPQPRLIDDLCPVRLQTSLQSLVAQTENGTSGGYPLVQTGSNYFYNYNSSGWTPHHWSQFNSTYMTTSGRGAGIMFTDSANRALYAFNSFATGGNTGALRANPGGTDKIQLLPVTSSGVVSNFQDPFDITWSGAVVAFSNSYTPIYRTSDGGGLWALVEYPPSITQTAQN